MRLPVSLAVLNAAVLACGVLTAGSVEAGDPRSAVEVLPTPVPTATADAPLAAAVAPPPEPPPPAPAAATEPPVAVPRVVTRTDWGPYAAVGPVVLHFPGDVVEAVGLHQSGHDGALPQSPVDGEVRIGRLDSRERSTHEQGAADVVVDPARPVRSPVTGTVLRAGTYALYCRHVDHFLVVEPDARPGWEVKLLHFEGLAVAAGDRLQAGVTVVGSGARTLPFTSQVDRHTAAPHWPHVHVEVVDPSIPDRPSGGGCS